MTTMPDPDPPKVFQLAPLNDVRIAYRVVGTSPYMSPRKVQRGIGPNRSSGSGVAALLAAAQAAGHAKPTDHLGKPGWLIDLDFMRDFLRAE